MISWFLNHQMYQCLNGWMEMVISKPFSPWWVGSSSNSQLVEKKHGCFTYQQRPDMKLRTFFCKNGIFKLIHFWCLLDLFGIISDDRNTLISFLSGSKFPISVIRAKGRYECFISAHVNMFLRCFDLLHWMLHVVSCVSYIYYLDIWIFTCLDVTCYICLVDILPR